MSRVTRVVRRATSPLRALPDFLIIGAQRAGSSSLFAYVCAHPSVAEPTHKEIHFFDNNWFRGLDWYRRYFPLRARMGGRITGEASPYYLFHPAAAGRVAETLPDVRLIAVLRDPVERAYSAYQLARRQGHETLEFEEALAREVERLAGEEERILADPRYASVAHRRFSYRTRGLYAEQLERWYERFPREQLLVVRSEDLFAEPGGDPPDRLCLPRPRGMERGPVPRAQPAAVLGDERRGACVARRRVRGPEPQARGAAWPRARLAGLAGRIDGALLVA